MWRRAKAIEVNAVVVLRHVWSSRMENAVVREDDILVDRLALALPYKQMKGPL